MVSCLSIKNRVVVAIAVSRWAQAAFGKVGALCIVIQGQEPILATLFPGESAAEGRLFSFGLIQGALTLALVGLNCSLIVGVISQPSLAIS